MLREFIHPNSSNFRDAKKLHSHPASTLINGLGRYVNGTADAPLAVVGVQAGKRYRFRLISISCLPSFIFSIDGHDMNIIEADGEYTEPLLVDSINILAGEII